MQVRSFSIFETGMKHCLHLFLAAALLVFMVFMIGCSGKDDIYRENLAQMEGAGPEGAELSEERVAEIREGIRKYRREVERKVEAADQLGIYYKMLAVQYLRAGMYGLAYESLTEALAIHPGNPILHYLSALSSAHIGKSKADIREKTRWLSAAEAHYLRALALDPVYVDALFGYAVLLTFELERPAEAESYLRTLLAREKANVDAMFLLGQVFYLGGRLEEAAEIYEEIAGITGVSEKKERALANKQEILKELYGEE